MNRRRYILALAILCLAIGLCIPMTASATVLPAAGESLNQDCLECHGSGSVVTGVTVDFTVGSVDKTTACVKCHWISPHPVHNADQTCNQLCHGRWDWGTRTDFWVSQTTSDAVATGSYFNSDASVYTSADELHRIHTNRGWMAELADYRPKCAGCHAPAACDACHASDTAHGTHGVVGDPDVGDPVTEETSVLTHGVPAGNLLSWTDYSAYEQSACIASGCHAGVAPGYFVDDSELLYVGDWTTVTNANLLGGSYTYSTSGTASFQLTFTGTGLSWVGQRTNTGGISEIYLDGVLRKTADCFIGTWGFDKNISVIKDLPYGEHTLVVKNSGRSTYLWSYVFVQGVRVYGDKPDFVASPDCSGCHDQHGDLAAEHTSTWSMSGCTSTGCHLTNELAEEHDKWEPENTCALCHGPAVATGIAAAVDDGLTGCDSCHTALLTESAHHTLHNSATVNQKGCSKCHSMYLDTEHANRGFTCAVCHETDDPATVAAVAAGDLRCVSCHGSQPHRSR